MGLVVDGEGDRLSAASKVVFHFASLVRDGRLLSVWVDLARLVDRGIG